MLFKGPQGTDCTAQIEAFDDTWHWNDSAESAFADVMRSGNANAATMLRAIRSFPGDNDMMAYLAMMAVRLLELHRVLKPTGSLYLHCDPTASLAACAAPRLFPWACACRASPRGGGCHTPGARPPWDICTKGKGQACPPSPVRRRVRARWRMPCPTARLSCPAPCRAACR